MTSGVRHIIFFALIIAMAYVSWAYMIKPANKALITERASVQQMQAKLAELEKARLMASDLDEQLVKVEEAIRIFESKLPPKSEIHTVLENVTLIAQKNGLTPKTISALKTLDKNGYIEQPLKMELHGDFSSYYSFLLELERLDRITKIRELTLRKKSQFEGQTEATFVMSIFFMNSKA